jgi:hypothetical protein
MIAKSSCQHCGGAFEFDLEQFEHSGEAGSTSFGQTIDCPHCKLSTIVNLRKNSFGTRPPEIVPRAKWQDWLWLKIVLGLLILAEICVIIWSEVHYGQFVFDFEEMAQDMGHVILTIIVGVLVLGFIAFATHQKLWLAIFSFVIIGLGVLMSGEGAMDYDRISGSRDGTVFQQQLAFLEFIGGGLFIGLGLIVYVGQKILKTIENRKS